MEKRNVKKVKVGEYILGDGIIRVQSMLSVRADDIKGNCIQAKQLYDAGCEILRVAIPNKDAIRLIPAIKETVPIPLVADIHFDYRLALEAVCAGIDKIRINPGNIGDDNRVKAVATACKTAGIPIRIGVNSGSIEKHILNKYGAASADAMVESALYHASLLERFDFDDIVISIKSQNVETMIAAYRNLAQKCDYPLHLGVTHAGTANMGIIKNAIGIGALLCDSIGDTIRVSLTADKTEEIKAGYDILSALDLRWHGVKLISCPACGRAQIDLISLATKVENALRDCQKNITVAVMGCAVNGPGEAREADIGIAGGDKCAIIFKKGEIIKKVPENEVLSALIQEIDKL